MKRTLRSTLCILIAVVLAGVLLKVGMPKGPVSAKAEEVMQPAVQKVMEVWTPMKTVAETAVDKVTEVVTGTPKYAPGTPTVLLSEPVVILGAPYGTFALPKGTQVKVLKQQGLYVQVQHKERVITIPRTATVFNVYATN